MESKEIKKVMQKYVKSFKADAGVIANLSAGEKQLEKRNMTICFGYCEYSKAAAKYISYNAKADFEAMVNDPKFMETLQSFGGHWVAELKTESKEFVVLYMRITF